MSQTQTVTTESGDRLENDESRPAQTPATPILTDQIEYRS